MFEDKRSFKLTLFGLLIIRTTTKSSHEKRDDAAVSTQATMPVRFPMSILPKFRRCRRRELRRLARIAVSLQLEASLLHRFAKATPHSPPPPPPRCAAVRRNTFGDLKQHWASIPTPQAESLPPSMPTPFPPIDTSRRHTQRHGSTRGRRPSRSLAPRPARCAGRPSHLQARRRTHRRCRGTHPREPACFTGRPASSSPPSSARRASPSDPGRPDSGRPGSVTRRTLGLLPSA